MLLIRREYRAKARVRPGFSIDFELVHTLQVKDKASLAPVDLDRVVIEVTARETRRLKGSRSSLLEAGEELNAVVDRALPLARPIDALALLDEGLADGAVDL